MTRNRYTGLIDKYRDRLPVAADTRAISLNEGATPLIELASLPALVRKKVRIHAKFEGLNPTGSSRAPSTMPSTAGRNEIATSSTRASLSATCTKPICRHSKSLSLKPGSKP